MTARVPYLDGLRALAILMVVAFHAVQFQPWFGSHDRGFWALFVSRNQGVYLFFVLSGFCLAYPTLARLRNGAVKFDLARFTARRIVRIIPPFWAAIVALTVALGVLLEMHVSTGKSMPDHVNPLKILEQALMFNLRPQWLNGSFWTLPIEAHWYFACPILIWVWTRSRRAFAVIALLCWFAALTTRFQAPDVRFLPAFMLGIVAADVRLRRPALAKYAPAAFLVFVAAALVPQLQPVSHACWELAMFCLVISVSELRALDHAFSARIFAPIAGASYSIYLIHSPMIGTIEAHLPAALPVPLAMFIAGACAIVGGLLFSIVAERPFRRGAVHDALLARLDRALPRAFRAAGIEPFVHLAAAPVHIPREAAAFEAELLGA